MSLIEFESKYGRSITPKELAEFLGLDSRTVIKYRGIWGGVEVAPGIYRFFENRIREKIDAEQNSQERIVEIQRERHGQRGNKAEIVPRRYQKVLSSSRGVGKRKPQSPGKRDFKDKHELLDFT